MRVEDVMTANPVVCSPIDHLGTAIWRMWKNDCGMLPVTDRGTVVGVITDRDVAVSVGLRGRRPSELLVGEVMQGSEGVVTCGPRDPLERALDLMRSHQLHRVPVVDLGRLVGIVTLNDLVAVASTGARAAGRPTLRDVVRALRGVHAPRERARAA
jgi:CBS domain-containing protein